MIINLKRVAEIIKDKKGHLVTPTAPTTLKDPSPLSIHAKPRKLNPLWYEFDKVRAERAKLSNKLYDQVKSGATTGELKELGDIIKDFQPSFRESL